jgi:hypothetical protein
MVDKLGSWEIFTFAIFCYSVVMSLPDSVCKSNSLSVIISNIGGGGDDEITTPAPIVIPGPISIAIPIFSSHKKRPFRAFSTGYEFQRRSIVAVDFRLEVDLCANAEHIFFSGCAHVSGVQWCNCCVKLGDSIVGHDFGIAVKNPVYTVGHSLSTS